MCACVCVCVCVCVCACIFCACGCVCVSPPFFSPLLCLETAIRPGERKQVKQAHYADVGCHMHIVLSEAGPVGARFVKLGDVFFLGGWVFRVFSCLSARQ